MNIVFLGTPSFGVKALEKLYQNDYKISAVICMPDKASGRNHKIEFSPIKSKALELNLTLLQPSNLKELRKVFSNLNDIDLCVVAAYGKIIPADILEIPKYGFVNVHASLLPYLRGAVPIPMSIKQMDEKTGITIMKMDEGMDTGDILSQEEVLIENTDTTETLTDNLSELGSKLLLETIPKYISKEIISQKQDDTKATYCYMTDITKDKGEINFKNMTAKEIDHLVRAFYPEPVAWFVTTKFPVNVIKVKIIEEEINHKNLNINCKEGIIELLEVQPAGKRVMSGRDFKSGYMNLIEGL